MPVAGAARKPAGQAVTRHKPVHDWVDVPDVPFKGGPALPKWRPCCAPWPKEARETWEAWRRMPHCVLWSETDWKFALKTVEIVAQLYDGEMPRWSASVLAELRDREKVMGTTFDYRRAIRVRYVAPGLAKASGASDGSVTRLNDYRDM